MQKSPVEQLIYMFSKLPGLGTRSARRIVLHLLQDKEMRLQGLIDGLFTASEQIVKCKRCGNLDANEICAICLDEQRENKVIAIVETVAELWAIERSGVFKGKYHVLGANSASEISRNSEQLGLNILLKNCKEHQTEEIIIATNSTLEGQTTAYFITEYFKGYPIKITRLASGIPIGGELDYFDEGTLSAALEARKLFS